MSTSRLAQLRAIPTWRNPLLETRSSHSPRCQCAICAANDAAVTESGDETGHPPTEVVPPRLPGSVTPPSTHREDPRR